MDHQRLLEQALSGLIIPDERKISFRSDDACTLAGDPDRLLLVLTNLISNAINHGQGDITFACARRDDRVLI